LLCIQHYCTSLPDDFSSNLVNNPSHHKVVVLVVVVVDNLPL
jgi:hypothetical protein